MFLIILGVFNLFVIRVNLSVAIVAMTTDRYETLENGTIIKYVSIYLFIDNIQIILFLIQEAEFKWNNVLQGYLLSGFFYGYVISQSFGGVIAKYIGGKNSLTMTVVCSSLASLISPWLAEWSPYALLVSRICVGLMEVRYHSI